MIPTEVENEYNKMAKLGFRKLYILKNNLTNNIFVSIIPVTWNQDHQRMEILRSNE